MSVCESNPMCSAEDQAQPQPQPQAQAPAPVDAPVGVEAEADADGEVVSLSNEEVDMMNRLIQASKAVETGKPIEDSCISAGFIEEKHTPPEQTPVVLVHSDRQRNRPLPPNLMERAVHFMKLLMAVGQQQPEYDFQSSTHDHASGTRKEATEHARRQRRTNGMTIAGLATDSGLWYDTHRGLYRLFGMNDDYEFSTTFSCPHANMWDNRYLLLYMTVQDAVTCAVLIDTKRLIGSN